MRIIKEKGPSPRTFHRAVEVEGVMFIFGGTDGKKLNDLYCISLDLV